MGMKRVTKAERVVKVTPTSWVLLQQVRLPSTAPPSERVHARKVYRFRLLQMVGEVDSCAAVVRDADARSLAAFFPCADIAIRVGSGPRTRPIQSASGGMRGTISRSVVRALPMEAFFHSLRRRATGPTPREPKIDIGGIATWASRRNDGSIRYAHSTLILTSSEYSAMSMPERRSTTSCLVGAKRP